MSELLFLATNQGVVVCQRQDGEWVELHRALSDQLVTSVIARQGVILAGTKNSIYRSNDLGMTWHPASDGLTHPHVRWLAYHPQISDREFAGTEPAGVFVSHDGAQTWRECREVVEMRRQYKWSLPYSPEAGCVRGFTFHGQRGYAAVEDGCVLVSDDAGDSWQVAGGSRGPSDHVPQAGFIHSDVHSIEVHPSSPDIVAAPTGGGFFASANGGITWDRLYPNCYCRAVWLDPADPQHMLLGPADGVDYNGRIESTHDGGLTWQPASTGLEVPWRRHMVERFAQLNGELFAVLSNGDLLAAPLETLAWRHILPQLPGVHAVTGMGV